MSSISELIWFDGKFVKHSNAKIPVTTHAIHYGTSIFEGIRAYWNGEKLNIFRLDEHVTRFRNSGKFYDITLKFSNKEIKDAIINLCRKNKIKTSCYIRPFYFVGQYGINLYVTKKAPTHAVVFCFPFGDLFNKNGITACISKWRKFNDSSTPTQAKMGGNYLNSILATQDAKKRKFDEAILLDKNNKVSEAPGENIFIVKNNTLITPPLSSSALDGITRKSILEFTKNMKIKTKIKEISKDELKKAEEVFLTGTAAEITPVIKIESKKIGDGKVGNITKQVMDTYTQIVMNNNKKFSKWLTNVY
ncbi:MAG: branched-chain amino acid transaminase [Thaumarchaeota archaeon]|nr:branched-chain amino acid transaminase [Nitrososphaerota archaeon]MBT4057591.1 branched-chain amino acid transaminase [Nitrososphaerota archaeon]MBT4175798.1 branched-chain amino acid transaminase [Nitrososphaerota archaeon]MBT4509277.1 branched-chain amino acid transaminase [Nitrososphaerota archaeon]MBT4675269.1 branched-chain amino acid transaminase [Nitrososphaerota archaeon]